MGRLRKEMVECGKDWEVSGVHAEPVGDSLTHLSGRIRGPMDTPFQGGIFGVDIHIPADYPFDPPKMKFTTAMWHPNVSSQTGAICLDILKDAWSPALTIKTALLSLCALLSAPEPNDPQDAQVASQYKRDYKEWCATAKYWTETYAMARGSGGSSGGGGPAGASSSSSSSAAGAGAGGAGKTPAPKPAPVSDPKLQQLIDMGFEQARAAAALKARGGNVEAALEYLFTS